MDWGGSVAISFREGRAALTCDDHGFGRGAEYLDPTNVSGEAAVGFNPRFLRSLLAAFRSETVMLEIRGYGDPVRITAPGSDAFSVLMPKRGWDEKRAIAVLEQGAESLPRAA